MIINKFSRKEFFIILALFLFIFSGFSIDLKAADWVVANYEPGGTFRHVTYGNGTFVAVGDAGLVRSSTDGMNWTNRDSKVVYPLFAVTYGGGLFVAVGYHGIIISSPDGSSWTVRAPFTSNGSSLSSVAYNGKDLFVAGGVDGRLKTSADGITWVEQTPVTDLQYTGMCWGNGKFIAAASVGAILYSSDGINWVKAGVNTTVNNYSAIYVDGLYIVGGGHGACFTSTNGISWTKRVTDTDNYLWDFSHTGKHFVTCGNSDGVGCSMILASTDGINWVRDRTPDYSTLLGVASREDGVTVAVGMRRLIIYNTLDGIGDGSGCAGGGGVTKTLRVTDPNGDEVLEIGKNFTIKWTSTNVTENIRIRYSTDGGSNYTKIADTANSGAYSWTVPNTASSNCLIRINAINESGIPNDTSDRVFTISNSGASPTITVTAPNGGESLNPGSNYTIKWTSTNVSENIRIRYSSDAGATYTKIDDTANDGSYTWTVPNISSSNCLIRVNAINITGIPSDESDSTFTIGTPAPSATITVTSPAGGEELEAGSTHTVRWTTTGAVGSVKIEYSTNAGSNWTEIDSNTGNNGSYSWTVPDTPSSQCLVRISDASDGSPSDNSSSFSIIASSPPEIVLDRNRFNFGYITGGASPCTQELFIYNGGGGTLDWTASADVGWINLDPGTGASGTIVTLSIDPTGLGTGSYSGTVTISDGNATNSPQTAEVNLTVKNAADEQPPFGDFATPLDGTTGVSGSIAVTGWALDDTCVTGVKIYRVVAGALVGIGNAVFVEGARPDVEQAYPDYPNNSRAGWGYMMLTNFLPEGQLVLKAIAEDNSGNQVELGTKTITIDNEHAIKPFGAIDTPDQGGTASGSSFLNWGWALTPQPNTIPTDGSTIFVWIDGKPLAGNVSYNEYREDIAGKFPDYNNSNGAVGYFYLDTTAFDNGVHTIQWSATDNVGNSDGIGSRYFSIQNAGSTSQAQTTSRISSIPVRLVDVDRFEPIRIKKGYSENIEPQKLYTDELGAVKLKIKELERIEIELGDRNMFTEYSGFMVVNNKLQPLPIGSTIDSKTGIFYWQPGAGFFGDYRFVFITKDRDGNLFEKSVLISIGPKFSN